MAAALHSTGIQCVRSQVVIVVECAIPGNRGEGKECWGEKAQEDESKLQGHTLCQ